MFDQLPGAQLVTDLVRSGSGPAASDAHQAAGSLIEELMAWQRVSSWVERHRLDTMRRFELARIEADRDLTAGTPADLDELSASERAAVVRLEANLEQSVGRFAAEEIALALNVSVASIDKQLRLARDLHGVHRDLGEALERGEIGGYVASMVAQATRRLPDTARRMLDPAVTADALELPAGRAIDAARARTAELDEDSDAATRRATEARYAFMKPMDDAMGMVGAVMPADEAVLAYRYLDRVARTRRRGGDERTLDQLRCDAFAEALCGRRGKGLDPRVGAADADRSADASAGDGDSAGASAGGGDSATTLAGSLSVQVVVSLSSLLGIDSRSAHLEGYGSIPSGAARAMLASGDVTIGRLLCDPDTGAVVYADPATYTPGPRLRHAVTCRDRYCRMPVCGARIQHLDHIQARVDAGLTTSDNLEGLCLRSHLAKHHPGWRVHGDADRVVSWTTPTAHVYASRPPPATGFGTGPPGELDTPPHLPGWLSRDQRAARAMASWLKRRSA